MYHFSDVQKQPPEVFYKKDPLKNFGKFTGKHLCQSLFFNKVPGLGLQLYLKRHSGTGVFLEILRNFPENLFYRTSLEDYFWMLSHSNMASALITTCGVLPPY